MYFKTKK